MAPEVQLKVNLFIPGFGKSGTSSLHVYLNQHPDISMSVIKEPHFFSRRQSFVRGFEHYNTLFESSSNKKYFGESSTTYIGSKIAIDRIKEYVKNPKFIVLVRNPIDRIYSHYTWLYSLGLETLPLREAVLKDMDTVFDADVDIEGNFKNYLFFSKYGTLLSSYISNFGAENIKIITTESLNKDVIGTLNECFEFLKLEKLTSIKEERQNITSLDKIDKTPMFVRKGLSYINDNVGARNKFDKVVHKLFIVKKKQKPLSEDDRVWLKGILNEEIKELKQITKMKFAEWSEFDSI
jgi:hypothetical protein